jgi:hypothetical protein
LHNANFALLIAVMFKTLNMKTMSFKEAENIISGIEIKNEIMQMGFYIPSE